MTGQDSGGRGNLVGLKTFKIKLFRRVLASIVEQSAVIVVVKQFGITSAKSGQRRTSVYHFKRLWDTLFVI